MHAIESLPGRGTLCTKVREVRTYGREMEERMLGATMAGIGRMSG